jgi:hypothetical protein
MGILATNADERVKDVRVDADSVSVDLMDGRTITVPLAWYPRLADATAEQLRTGRSPAPAMASIGLTSTKT